MELFKKIGIKFLLLITVIILLNFVYKSLFFKADIHLYSPLYEKFNNAIKESDVLYFGESSNASYGPSDTCLKSISQFIADHFPSMQFASVDTGAIHAGIYYELIKKIPEDSKVKAIIVTMNLRSFNAEWRYSNLESALKQSLVLVYDRFILFSRFLLALNTWENMSKQECEGHVILEWRNLSLQFPFPITYKTTQEWELATEDRYLNKENQNKKKAMLAQQYVKTYAFNIDTLANIRIKDFDNIVKYCKKKNYKLYFNLLAENIEKANELIGKELTDIIKFNRDILIKRYSKNAVIIDNVDKIASTEFIDQNWTTEHYYQAGRMIIAQNVARAISKDYQNQFKDIYAATSLPFHKQGDLFLFLQRLKTCTAQIKSSKEWFDRLKIKAIEQNMTVDTIIYLDAKWLIEHTDKIVIDNLEEKIALIEKYKMQMQTDTTWNYKIKQKAIRDKISLDSAIIRDAIWLASIYN